MTLLVGGTGSAGLKEALHVYGGYENIGKIQKLFDDRRCDTNGSDTEWLGTASIVPWLGGFAPAAREKGVEQIIRRLETFSSNPPKDNKIVIIGFSHGANIALRGLILYLSMHKLLVPIIFIGICHVPTQTYWNESECYASLCKRAPASYYWINCYEPDDVIQQHLAYWIPGDAALQNGNTRSYGHSCIVERMIDTPNWFIGAHDQTPSHPKLIETLAETWQMITSKDE